MDREAVAVRDWERSSLLLFSICARPSICPARCPRFLSPNLFDVNTRQATSRRMEEPYPVKHNPKTYGGVDSSSGLEAQLGVYHAKALRAQTRLYETLDALSEMERTHAEQLALSERREGRMKQKMKTYAETSRKAEEETEDMRQAVLKLIEKVEKNNGYKSLKPSQLHVSSLLEPIEPIAPRRAAPADVEDLLSYAASMIDVVRRERNLERKAHQKTKEWAQSRISVLEAQLSRRETELAQCATHCFSVRDASQTSATHRHDEPVPYQQYWDTLQWTMSKNRTLELEISALSEKLAGVRRHEGTRSDGPSKQQNSPPSGGEDSQPESSLTKVQPNIAVNLDQQVQQLGALIDTFKEDRRYWRVALDGEKSEKLPSEVIQHRMDAVEEECKRLRDSQEDLRSQLEAKRNEDEARESQLNEKIQTLESQLATLSTIQVVPQPPPDDGDVDTIRIPQQPQSVPMGTSPEDLLDDGGEVSMDLATPLVPTIYLEPPTESLEPQPFDSPDPIPQLPSRTPSPLDLSPPPPSTNATLETP